LTSFSDLGLIEPLVRAVAAEGYDTPTPVQAAAIPVAVRGRDVLGVAQTGTGKTAAFTLPILQLIDASRERTAPHAPRALILTPTRELAIQIGESIRTYGRYLRVSHTVVFGGVGQNPQVSAMRRGVDILVATPGRLLDLIDQGHIDLGLIEFFVLDEADRMLDMGFIRDVKHVVAEIPQRRQTLFFSATMPQAITGLASELLKNPEHIEIKPAATTAERVSQRVLFVDKSNKRELLHDLFNDPALDRAIVFTRTKHGANKVAKYLGQRGIGSDAIHGNKSQTARQKALDGFKAGKTRVLVATDIASRGIDVDDVSHVINFDLPNEPESYVHRIGRTARAGSDGIALSFCDDSEVAYLHAIEHIIRQKVDVDAEHAFHDDRIARSHANGPARGNGGGGRGSNGRSGGRSGGGRGQGRGNGAGRGRR
jgi:ATP-dependent RNA helicase RhlE